MPFPEPIRTPAIAIGLLLIAAHLLKADETGTKNRINKFLGDLAYPIYIFHYFLIGPIQVRSAPIFEAMGLSSSVLFFAIFLLNVIVCLFVCSLVVFWEDPIIEKYRSLLRS